MPKKSMTYLLANTYIVNQFLLLKQTFRKIAQLSEIIYLIPDRVITPIKIFSCFFLIAMAAQPRLRLQAKPG